MSFDVTAIADATQATPVIDAAKLPADVSGADRYVTVGDIRSSDVDIVVASGAITITVEQFISLNLGTAIALTVSNAPVLGYKIEIVRVGSGAVTHTVVLPSGVTWDGTNRTANFADDGDYLRAVAISATRYQVAFNSGVTFSA